MSPEAQNKAIAEWLGVKYHKPTEEEIKRGSYYQYEPNYCGDLNAMHEADPHGTCAKQLTIMLGVNKWTDSSMIAERVLRATADQRAEALLKTIGKWTEQ